MEIIRHVYLKSVINKIVVYGGIGGFDCSAKILLSNFIKFDFETLIDCLIE